VTFPTVSGRFCGKKYKCRAKTLPAAADDVFCNRPDKNHVRVKAMTNQIVYGRHIGGDNCSYKLWLHRKFSIKS